MSSQLNQSWHSRSSSFQMIPVVLLLAVSVFVLSLDAVRVESEIFVHGLDLCVGRVDSVIDEDSERLVANDVAGTVVDWDVEDDDEGAEGDDDIHFDQ